MKKTGPLVLLLLSAIQLTVWCHGEPFLQKPLPSPDKETITCFAGGLPGSPVKAEGLIGTSAAGVTLRENGRIPVRTLLLVDNSRSVSEGSRKKIRALLSAVVEDHREGESFCLAVFGEEPAVLLPFGASPEELLHAIEALSYQDQNSYLPEALLSAAALFPEEEEPSYDRVIVASDGGESRTGGATEEEVVECLRQRELPVFSLGTLWNGHPEGQTLLASLSRRSGGRYLLVQDSTENAELIQMLRETEPVTALSVSVPPDLRDGSLKNLAVTLSMEDGSSIALSREVRMPQAVLPTATPVPTPTPGVTPVPTKPPVTKAPVRVISPTAIPVREPESFLAFLTSRENVPLGVPPILWPLAAALLAAAGFVIIPLLKREKDSEEEVPLEAPDALFQNTDEKEDPEGRRSPGQTLSSPRGQMDHASRPRKPPADSEVTQLLFAEPSEERLLLLRTIREPVREYQMPLKSALVAGKSRQSSDLAIEDDPAISRHHCRFSLEEGDVFLEDMQSRNGTWLNRHKITGKEKVSSGDRIRIGDTELELEIR